MLWLFHSEFPYCIGNFSKYIFLVSNQLVFKKSRKDTKKILYIQAQIVIFYEKTSFF